MANAAALTESHRQAQVLLSAGVAGDVSAAFSRLDVSDLSRTFPAYYEALAPRIEARRAVSGALASRYYGAARAADGVAGSAPRIATPRIVPEQLMTSLYVTGPRTLQRALARGDSAAQARSLAVSQTSRSALRHVLNGGREVILRSVQQDDAAKGYMRISDSDPCAFCAMLIGRGAVYKREATAGFDSHDGCGCSAQPFWKSTPAQRQTAEDLQALWQESGARFSGARARQEFRKAYEAQRRTAGAAKPQSVLAKAQTEALVPAGRASAWTELSKAQVVEMLTGRYSVNPQVERAAQNRLDAVLARRVSTEEQLSEARALLAKREAELRAQGWTDEQLNPTGGSWKNQDAIHRDARWRIESLEKDLARSDEYVREYEGILNAAKSGTAPPAVVAAAEKHAKTYRVFMDGPHELHVNRSSASRAKITDAHLERARQEMTATVENLPEWRRYTKDGTERRYAVVVDGQAGKAKANGYTYLGNEIVWMNPRLLSEVLDASPVDRGTWSMPAHRTVSGWRYTLTHEFGHTVDRDGSVSSTLKREALMLARTQTRDYDDLGNFVGTDKGTKKARDFMSDYSRTNAEESYAELFAEWSLGSRTNPMVREFEKAFQWDRSWDDYSGPWSVAGAESKTTVGRTGFLA